MGNKVAVVTGSTRGIGAGIAEALMREGFYVVLSGTGEEAQQKALLEQYRVKGYGCDYVRCNIQHDVQRKELIEIVTARYQKIDLFVNNAGISVKRRADLLEVTEESLDELLNVNLKGTFFLNQLCAKAMIAYQTKAQSADEAYAPKIVNVSSISAYTSSTPRGEYCISKAGVSMASQLFADRLSAHNIPVFEVRPGIILTDMTSGVRDKYEKMIAEGVTPIKRFGLPEDVGKCVAAIGGGYFDFCTGQVFNVDGGFSIRRL